MNRMSNATPSPAGMRGPADIREFETDRPARRAGVRAARGRSHTIVHSAAGATGRETAAARA